MSQHHPDHGATPSSSPAAPRRRVVVLGAGSWGTALACSLAGNGHDTTLVARHPERAREMSASGRNERYLPGIAFPPALRVTHAAEKVLPRAEIVLVAVPSDGFAATVEAAAGCMDPGADLVWATKGFEPGGGLLDAVVRRFRPPGASLAVLSGPSFAGELAAGLPTAVTLAGEPDDAVIRLVAAFRTARFRVYRSDDLIGVQVGGAVKNVLAVAAGISDGLHFGANARAALMTRGIAEISRLGVALGARSDTFAGLAGIGDLILTCTDDQSRNRRFGLLLAAGKDRRAAEAEVGQVVEGARTAITAAALAGANGVEMPIVEQVRRVVAGEVDPRAAVEALLAREPGKEFD